MCTWTTGRSASNVLCPSQDLPYTHHLALCIFLYLSSLDWKLLSPSDDMNDLWSSSPVWHVLFSRRFIHTLWSRSHVSSRHYSLEIPVIKNQSIACDNATNLLIISGYLRNLCLRFSHHPRDQGENYLCPHLSVLISDASRSPLAVLMVYTWMSKNPKATRDSSSSMQHSGSKPRQRINLLRQQFWLAGGCFYLLQNRISKHHCRLLPLGINSWFRPSWLWNLFQQNSFSFLGY